MPVLHQYNVYHYVNFSRKDTTRLQPSEWHRLLSQKHLLVISLSSVFSKLKSHRGRHEVLMCRKIAVTALENAIKHGNDEHLVQYEDYLTDLIV
jgi:hypothetical protein